MEASPWFLCAAHLAVLLVQFGVHVSWLKICLGLTQMSSLDCLGHSWPACARGEAKILSIKQQVSDNFLAHYMQQADP